MARDNKKKKADKKARVATKQEKKATQKEKKASKKPKDNDDSDAEDIDLDSMLAEYQKQQEQFLKVTESSSDAPSPRSSSTLVASPSNSNEIFLFGGEYYNGSLATFFNDLYIYKTNSDDWRRVTSPNSPLPRSGHAMCQGGNAGGIYLFGGEFSSPKQGTFYHYNDFWRLDTSTREWTKLEAKNGPSARSGHRMTYFKNYIVLFGGFQDTSQQTKYLQDIWLYDTQKFTWHSPTLPPASQKPDPRSSFSLLPHESGVVLYGGYSRVKASSSTSKAAKAGKAISKVVMKPIVHQDTWFLRITKPEQDVPANVLPVVRWERRKRSVNTPNPPRAGATMAYHKGRGISFGGVHDVEQSEEGIDSEFFNQLFAYNIDRNRFFQLTLRRPRTSAKKATPAAERGKRGRGKADEEELLRNLSLIENKGTLGEDDRMDIDTQTAAAGGNEGDEEKVEKPVMWEMPHPRFNAQLTVQDDTLYIFGGTFEKGDREYTFDEMWSIDLGKLNGVKEIFRREIEDWQGSEDEDSEDDEEDDEEESGDDESDEDARDDEPSTPATSVGPEEATSITDAVDNETIDSEPVASKDNLPHPRPFESLRDFFVRTGNDWQDATLSDMKSQGRRVDEFSIKEVRKRAFDRAELQWWDDREEIQALEDEQEAAGISEVVSLDQRGGGDSGGAGRRR